MLPDKRRLRKKGEYQRVYEKGKKFYGRHFILFVCDNNLPVNRYGIVASKKVGHAVERNKARRRVRELIRKKDGEMAEGHDIVLVLKASTVTAPYDSLQEDFVTLFKKARLC